MSTLGYSSGWSQADTRRPAKLRDQHGRTWFAWVENRSGAPTGPISPSGWSAPWYPDQAYLSIDPDDPRTLRIDYARALRERLEAHEEYKKLWTEKAVARNMDPADDTHRPALLQLVGPSPAPYQPYKAAMDGNKWILGFTTKADARLIPYLPIKRTQVERRISELESFADEDGPEIQVHGSGGLLQTLFRHDLVDVLRLWQFPVVLGTGKRLFGAGAIPRGFRLVDTQVSTTGAVLHVYERAGEVKYGEFEVGEAIVVFD